MQRSGQSKWMRAREERRKMGDIQGAVTNHLEGGEADEASLNSVMKPLITAPGSPGDLQPSWHQLQGKHGRTWALQEISESLQRFSWRQLLDGTAWGDVPLDLLLTNKEEEARAVIINSNLDCREPNIEMFSILWGSWKTSSWVQT